MLGGKTRFLSGAVAKKVPLKEHYELFEKHLPIAREVARKFITLNGGRGELIKRGIESQDVHQLAQIGLWHGILHGHTRPGSLKQYSKLGIQNSKSGYIRVPSFRQSNEVRKSKSNYKRLIGSQTSTKK